MLKTCSHDPSLGEQTGKHVVLNLSLHLTQCRLWGGLLRVHACISRHFPLSHLCSPEMTKTSGIQLKLKEKKHFPVNTKKDKFVIEEISKISIIIELTVFCKIGFILCTFVCF